jgi:hypothetical protein
MSSADLEKALTDIVEADWATGDVADYDGVYWCRFCKKTERETKKGFLINHFEHCPAYIAKKALDKYNEE